jgi:hypothetical protein
MAKNSEYLSVSELAASLGKSKQWIYVLVNRDPELRKYMTMIDGHKKFRKAVIAEYFRQEVVVKPEDELVSTLREQLALANKQIEELTEALKHEQLLHGQTAARLQQMTLMIEDKQKSESQPAPRPEPVRRRKGLRGLFGL